MNIVDGRGCALSGATPGAVSFYETALAKALAWRSGPGPALSRALHEAPDFVMAHVLEAYLLLSSRDPRRVRSARPILARAAVLASNERERGHLEAISAVLGDDYEGAKARLAEVLRREPRDVLALHAAHGLDHITGDAVGMLERVAAVLPAWSIDLPGHHAVLSMHAFALEECGEYGRAEQVARAALALDPFDARAHHAMAHVFEMSDRPADGLRWLEEHVAAWAFDTVVATHGRWHLALFHLSLGQVDDALAVYDECARAGPVREVADLIDGAALLWRVELAGGDPGGRWDALAEAWSPHTDDRFCSFNDLHAMLAFVGARQRDRAERLERVLVRGRSEPTRHGLTTRLLGLPACRALRAFGRRDDDRAIALLASLPPLAHRLGGSHAQRDVLNLTLRRSLERVRSPALGLDVAPARLVGVVARASRLGPERERFDPRCARP
jgi:tetratricopeptide (TPR) repeat protein